MSKLHTEAIKTRELREKLTAATYNLGKEYSRKRTPESKQTIKDEMDKHREAYPGFKKAMNRAFRAGRNA